MQKNSVLKLISPQLVNKFPELGGAPKYKKYQSKLLPILRQINPFLNLPFSFLHIRFNIILPSAPRFSKWFLSFVFLHQNTEINSPFPSNFNTETYINFYNIKYQLHCRRSGASYSFQNLTFKKISTLYFMIVKSMFLLSKIFLFDETFSR